MEVSVVVSCVFRFRKISFAVGVCVVRFRVGFSNFSEYCVGLERGSYLVRFLGEGFDGGSG